MLKTWIAAAAVVAGLGAGGFYLLGRTTSIEARSVPELISELQTIAGRESSDNLRRMHIAETLAKRGESVVEPLLALLTSDSPLQARIGATEALGKIGDRRAFQAIAAGVHHSEKSVRSFSIYALKKLPGSDVDDVLLSALSSDDRGTLFSAAAVLGERRETRAVPRLQELYDRGADPGRGPDAITRSRFGEALAKIGTPDAVAFLAAKLVMETSAFVRMELARFVAPFDDPHVADALRQTAKHPEVVAAAYAFFLENPGVADDETLLDAFRRYGGSEMTEAFLASGNPALVKAARAEAASPVKRPKTIEVK